MTIYTNKIVNGVEVPLTAAEITALQARDVAYAAAQAAAAPEKQRLADADAVIKADTQVATWRAKPWAQFSADFDALTTAAKLEVMKRIAFLVLRRLR